MRNYEENLTTPGHWVKEIVNPNTLKAHGNLDFLQKFQTKYYFEFNEQLKKIEGAYQDHGIVDGKNERQENKFKINASNVRTQVDEYYKSN